MERGTLPSTPPWSAPRSSRCRRLSWRRTETWPTANERLPCSAGTRQCVCRCVCVSVCVCAYGEIMERKLKLITLELADCFMLPSPAPCFEQTSFSIAVFFLPRLNNQYTDLIDYICTTKKRQYFDNRLLYIPRKLWGGFILRLLYDSMSWVFCLMWNYLDESWWPCTFNFWVTTANS